MSYTFYKPVYGFDADGMKVELFRNKYVDANAMPIGGRLYYLDPNSDEVLDFYTSLGRKYTLEQVQQAFTNKNHQLLASLTAYKVVDAGASGKDLCYAYNDSFGSSCYWTYKDGSDNWVYTALGTKNGIGFGKSNTATVLAADSGAYGNYTGCVWNYIKQLRTDEVGGCNDWFLPNEAELEEIRKAIGFEVITTSDTPVVLNAGVASGGTIAGVADGSPHYRDVSTTRTCYPSNNAFLIGYCWSSYEFSNQYVRYWNQGSQSYSIYLKHLQCRAIAVRSF